MPDEKGEAKNTRIPDGLSIGISRQSLIIFGFLGILLGFFSILWFVPIVYAIWMSLFSDFIRSPEFVALENYASVFYDPKFWGTFGRTVLFGVGSTILSIIIGMGFALAINSEIQRGKYLRTLMIFPFLIPTIVVVFLWTFMVDPNVGVINQLLLDFGLINDPISLFNTIDLAMPAVILVSVWKYASFAFFIILARLQAIDDSLYERAKVSGASPWQMFTHITLPNLRGVLLVIILVRGIFMFNKFDIIWLTTQGGPLDATLTLPIMVYQFAFSELNLPKAAALSVIMFLILSAISLIYFRVSNPEEEVSQE